MTQAFGALEPSAALERAGLRFGQRGTHTSRTMMLRELSELFETVPADATADDYGTAIVEENALGKRTWATRRSSRQRLNEMYGLDLRLPLFRVLRRLWEADPGGRPLLALLCVLARDPLLRLTAGHILSLAEGEELRREALADAIRAAVGSRFSDGVLARVARHAASSWTQSGHLEGRTRKIRRRVRPTRGATALALWLGEIEGLAGISLLDSDWSAVLDARGSALLPFALEARRYGLIHARAAGDVIEIDARRLDRAAR